MDNLPHLFPIGTGTTQPYIYARQVGGARFDVPPRDDRVSHGQSLIDQLTQAESQSQIQQGENSEIDEAKGIVLAFESDPEFKLQLTSLESRQSGIELRNSRISNGVMHATVFVPQGKIAVFVNKFRAYAHEETASGRPKNLNLAASIASIRLAALEHFWTDAGALPSDRDESNWWEIWLQAENSAQDSSREFRVRAATVGCIVSTRELKFPERVVLLIKATLNEILAIENLFDLLAELRSAKILTGEFVNLPPRDQADIIDELLTRIRAPASDAPAVCHLDTGVNRGHPLLGLALDENHCLAVEPTWSVTDRHPHQHGTGMAGIGLYGDLSEKFNSSGPVVLTHRLESVKILPDVGTNAPELYGEITSQAISRIEIAVPGKSQRAFALTVTADSRDEGYPSSWSAALDQIISGASEENFPRRLICVVAGNTSSDGRNNFPDHNHVSGIEDPAQAWNALTVGAFTERATIRDTTYRNWIPVSKPGLLSPASRTSLVWEDQSWPLKPDIVMEGGNNAINPESGSTDDLEDLMLLTTQLNDVSGALLTFSGDTSAATASAARYAAMIWSHYPSLWPETVRGMLVHSARWTDAMLEEFPHANRRGRLRVYGYGVPNLQRALWSANHHATLMIQDSIQPYKREGSETKTNDMQLHRLPWPKAVLEQLGETPVRMRVTLSYFVEPSPGRRGWTNKHRYQSHGLRFDVKRPTDADVQEFQRRLTRAAWDEDEESVDFGTDDRNWHIGQRLRSRGSIHSDVWTGTAVQLANSDCVAVYPVSGWWRERKHLECWNRQARYALIISLETDSTDVDLYTSVAAQINAVVPTEIDIPTR